MDSLGRKDCVTRQKNVCEGCRQNMDPPSGPLNFFGEKTNNKLKLYTIRVLHTTASFVL